MRINMDHSKIKSSLLSEILTWCQRNIATSFCDLFFPLNCLSCSKPLPEDLTLLCTDCLSLMEKTNPKERCRSCFSFIGDDSCHSCMKYPSPFYRTYAPFQDDPATLVLIQKLNQEAGAHLAPSLAGLLLLSLEKSPIRDADIVVSSSDSGSQRLAKAFSNLSGQPYLKCFQAKSLLDRSSAIRTSTSLQIADKRVLLISTGLQPFSHYLHEGQEISTAFPRSIQKLFFCRRE